MSNIAIQRTDPLEGFVARNADTIRASLATLILLVIWISFEPFSAGGDAPPRQSSGTGNLINQIGFTALFAVTLLGCLMLVPPASVTRLFSVTWILTLIMLAFSMTIAPDFDDAWRGFLFTMFGVIVAACVVVLPVNADGFCRVLLVAGGAVVTLSYAGLLLFPEASIHSASELESQHAGLWRGLFTHKNVAGPIMATLVFAGIYMIRRRMWWAGLLLTVGAAVFVYNTGSRTSAALVPLAIILVLLPATLGMRMVGGLAVLAAILGAHALTVGTVFVPFLDDILRSFDEAITFTGRTEIWSFAKDYVFARPWTGYGFDGFWDSITTDNAERHFDQIWDPRRIIHGHNGFMDLVLQFGIPVTVLMAWLLVVAPVFAYMRTLRLRENQLLADFFLMIVAFTSMNAALESFYFQRSDPVWLTLVVALFGLRMTSRFPVAGR